MFFDDSNAVFPFAKVSKQFQNGRDGGDSIFSFFEVISPVFRKGIGGATPQYGGLSPTDLIPECECKHAFATQFEDSFNDSSWRYRKRYQV